MYIKANKNLDIVVLITTNPYVMLASATSPHYKIDELTIASALQLQATGKRLKVMEFCDYHIPAYTDYILKGRITNELTEEGPFLDITGTYDRVRMQPIVEFERMYVCKSINQNSI
jgi:UbiD family decarboxylase